VKQEKPVPVSGATKSKPQGKPGSTDAISVSYFFGAVFVTGSATVLKYSVMRLSVGGRTL
jgi:hypothetical protein